MNATPESALSTNRRDPDLRIAPSSELLRSAALGETVDVHLKLPMYGEFTGIGVTDYDDIREILDHESVHQGLKGVGEGSTGSQPGFLLYYDGQRHLELRRMFKSAFSSTRVAAMRSEIEAIVNDLLDEMEIGGKRTADLQNEFSMQVPSKVVCGLLGVSYDDHDSFEEWTKKVTDLDSSPEEALGGVREIHDYMAEEVRTNRLMPGDNLIGALCRESGEFLTDEEITGLAMITLLGGQENTANSISLSIYALLQHPDQLKLVRDDESVTRRAVEELLRYTSLVAAPPNRIMVDDATIGGASFKTGDRLVLSFLAANWSETLVGQDVRLDVQRKPTQHLAFGHGVHACPGQHLARLEMSIAIPALLRRFPTLRIDADPDDLGWRWNASAFGVRSFPVAW